MALGSFEINSCILHLSFAATRCYHYTYSAAYTAMVLYQVDDHPPPLNAAFIGFQHLLAMFGGILTAPLLVALGMGLDAVDTTYMISAALVVSGLATLVQINRIGIMGTGLLSVQGTSFAFIGPLVFSYEKLVVGLSSADALGVIFGSSALCAALMIGLSFFTRYLKNIITTNVAGATIILLGLSLVGTTLNNLNREFINAGGLRGDGLQLMLLAGGVFGIILVLSRLDNPWLRLSSITIGLAVGIAASAALGIADFSVMGQAPLVFIPELARYPLAIDLQVMAVIMPIFLVSAMESMGDITATGNLSEIETGTDDYWTRMQGGIMAGAAASLVAALVSTFPSTTFSQNNGVIRLTGVCSRYVGNYVAVFLIVLGLAPVIATLFQAIPAVVVFGATLLMFFLVAVSGYRVIEVSAPRRRDYLVVVLAITLGYLVSAYIDQVPGLGDNIVMVLQFPVSTGAVLAILLELVIPNTSD